MIPGKRRLLFLYPQSLGPSPDPHRNSHFHLSAHFSGDLIYDWVTGPEARERRRPAIEQAIGDFAFHFDPRWDLRRRLGPMRAFQFYVSKGLELLHREGPYDAIVAYGPFRTGMAALALRARTGVPVVVELAGNYLRSYDFSAGWSSRVKRHLARPALSYVASHADFLRLLYPTQLEDLGGFPRQPRASFHEFVPVDDISPSEPRDRVIFFLGYPFFLKGVDLLIRAFLQIADRYPDWSLRIVGHCPDPSPFLRLAGGHPRVEIARAVPHADAMRLMERCGVFVLPSRTEGMGRVLLEAMAAQRPIVASRVDGIPTYVTHEENGLLFTCGDARDLALQLDRILGEPGLAERLAAAGRARVMERYSVAAYVQHFADMIEQVAARRRERG